MKRLFIIINICFIFVITTTLLAETSQQDEINRDYDRLMREDRNNVESHRSFINKWKAQSDILISIYEKTAENLPDNPAIQYALGYAYAITERDDLTDKAVEQFKKSVELKPDFQMAHFSLGAMYLRKGEYKQAEIELQKAIELDETSFTAYFNLGEVYRNQKQSDLALLAYKRSIEIRRNWGWSHYGLGMIYLDQNGLEDAEAEFKQAINYNPEIADAYFKLGQIYARQGRDIELVSQQYRNGQKALGAGQKARDTEKTAFYELGKIFAEKGNSGLAIQSYKNAINIDPNMAEAQFELGTEYYRMGLKERAIEHYRQAFQADPSLITHFLDEAKKYYESGNFELVMASLDKFLAISPNNAEAHYYYAETQRQLKNIDEAIKHYEDAVRIDPNFAKAYMPLGDLYYSQNKLSQAISAYRKAMALDQSMERYFFEQGSAALESAERLKPSEEKRMEYLNTARTNLDKSVMLYPDDVEANYKLGRAYDEMGDKDGALKYYQKAVELEPFRYDALIRIARIYRKDDRLDDSLAVLAEIISMGEKNSELADSPILADAYRMSADIHETSGNFDEAISSLEEAVKLDPSDAESLYKLGLFYEEKRNNTDRAMELYEAVIKLDQTKAEPFLKLGDLYVEKGVDEKKIMDVYEKGLIIDPNHPQIQYDLALLYKKHGDYDKAIEHYDKANELLPDNYQWHYEYAKLLDGRDNSKAVKEYTKTIALKRDFAPAYYDRAMLVRKAKSIDGKVYRNEQIIEDLKQAIELDPNFADAYFNIGVLYKEMELSDLAKEYFEKTIRVNPEYTGVHLQLGLIAEMKHEFDKAISEYQKELDIYYTSNADNEMSQPSEQKSRKKDIALAHQRLGFLYSNHSLDLEKAEEQFIKSLELEPDNVDTLIRRGNNLYSMGRYGQSADQFENVLQIDPKNPTANYNLASVYERWGKKKLAIEQWQRFLEMNPPGSWADEARQHLRELGVK